MGTHPSEGITQGMCVSGEEDLESYFRLLLATHASDKSEMLKILLVQVR